MKIKLMNDDINNSITEYKILIDFSLSREEIINSYRKELDKIYNESIYVSSFNLCDNFIYSYDICSLFFEYNIKYNYDIGFIYLYSLDKNIINLYKENFYKIKNEFKRKKDTIFNDVDKVYNSNKAVLIFKDTRFNYINDELLIKSINSSKKRTKLYDVDFELTEQNNENNLKINLTDDRLLSASLSYLSKKMNTAIVNIGDGIHPGGGVIHGMRGIEESICRISTLYPLLNQTYLFDNFYRYNKEFLNINSNKIIYIPNVYVFKTDEDYPTILQKDDWYKINVITTSFINQNNIDINDEDLYEIIKGRLEQVFKVAVVNNVEVLILPPFDIGNNLNNPIVCANAYKYVIDKYKNSFKYIHLAIPSKGVEKFNYYIYKKILNL